MLESNALQKFTFGLFIFGLGFVEIFCEENVQKWRHIMSNDCLDRKRPVYGKDGELYYNPCAAARQGIDLKCSCSKNIENSTGEPPLCVDVPCYCRTATCPNIRNCCRHFHFNDDCKEKRRKKRAKCIRILRKWKYVCRKQKYKPVCADNGRTYRNMLRLKQAGQKVACKGRCPCPNTGSDTKVCGDDGVTYVSAAAAKAKKVNIACQTECPCKPSCSCEETVSTVCGVDDVTYNNTCQAGCADIIIKCNQSCPCPKNDTNTCLCQNSTGSVCGSDGVTYPSGCHANCVNVAVSCPEACPCPDLNQASPPCTCQNNSQPVCGKDGVTYQNRCFAGCANADIHCETCCPCPDVPCDPNAQCGENFDLVCGHDKRTYPNECCAQFNGIDVKSPGGCPCTVE